MLSIIKTFNLFMTPLYHVVDRMKKAGIMPLIMGRKRSQKKANNDWRTIVYSRLHYIESSIFLLRCPIQSCRSSGATQSHAQRKKSLFETTRRLLSTRAPFQHIPQHTAAGRRAPGRPPLLVSFHPCEYKKKKTYAGAGAFKIKMTHTRC